MKNKVLLVVIVFSVFFSCHPSNKNSYFEEYNSVNNLDQLIGIFDLELGKTSISDIIKKYKPSYFSEKLNPDYSLGFYKLETTDVDDRKKIETAINERYKNVSQFYYHEYKYDDVIINSISLFFLDNILVGIYIENPGLRFNLPKYFIEKYDDGVGSKKSDTYWNWDNKCKCYDIFSQFNEEKREWDNNVINVVYYNEYSYSKYRSRGSTTFLGESFNSIKENRSNKEYMLYSLKEKYKVFDELMKKAIQSEEEALRVQKKEKANSLI